jgi:hypothetical protein
MIPSNSIVFQTTPNGYTDMLCSPMFDIDTLPGPFPQLGTKSSCVCDRQSRLKWVQEGNHYDAISTQSIGSDSLYRFGRKRCWTHPLIILIYPVVCLPVVRMPYGALDSHLAQNNHWVYPSPFYVVYTGWCIHPVCIRAPTTLSNCGQGPVP